VKLATFIPPGAAQPVAGAVDAGRVQTFEHDVCVVDVLAGADAQTGEDSYSLDEVTLLAPVPDPGRLDLRTWVNGELRQDSNTSDLLFTCREVVDVIAQTCTLRPGDLILTGTPSGVGQGFNPPRCLKSEDVIRIEIEGLGQIEHGVT
jgi:hypothetical protein